MISKSPHSDYLNSHLLSCKSIEYAPLQDIYDLIDRDSFACVRGLIDPEEINAVVKPLKSQFNPDNDIKISANQRDALRRNCQRLYVGGTASDTLARPRFLRTFYNPMWAEDIYHMHTIFRRVVQFRNLLNGSPLEFACEQAENGVWTAARIHHYPRGGGFMDRHQDRTFYDLSRELDFGRCLQILIVMSIKGEDYEHGGAYIEVDNERIYFEDYYKRGDLVVMDHRIFHGVEEIDPLAPLVVTSPSGRLAGFCNLFHM
jgi:hypothetical protein